MERGEDTELRAVAPGAERPRWPSVHRRCLLGGGPLCGPGGERGSPLSPLRPAHPCKARPRTGHLWRPQVGHKCHGHLGQEAGGGVGLGGTLAQVAFRGGWGAGWEGVGIRTWRIPPGDLEGAGPEPVAAGWERRAGRGAAWRSAISAPPPQSYFPATRLHQALWLQGRL